MTPRVSLICLSDRPAHLRLFVAAMMLQTCPHWEVSVLDQSEHRGVIDVVNGAADHRITRHVVPRLGDWGQAEKMRHVAAVAGDFVGFPNDDAYYCPLYLELMLEAVDRASLDLVYCDWVSASDFGRHTYVGYEAQPRTGYIDVGGFLVRRSLLEVHGWPDRGPTGDGHLIEGLVRAGVRHARVPRLLYVKN